MQTYNTTTPYKNIENDGIQYPPKYASNDKHRLPRFLIE